MNSSNPVADYIIPDRPWAQELYKTISNYCLKAVANWSNIVITLGDDGSHVKTWTNVYREQIETVFNDLEEDMKSVHSKVLRNIEQLLEKLQKICTTLHTDMPIVGTLQLTLYEEERELKKKIEEYEVILEERISEIRNLQERQLSVCRSLGRPPRVIPDNPLPSSGKLEELYSYIENLEAEKFNREEKFLTKREEILEIVSELNLKPNSDFERELLTNDLHICVSDDYLKQLNGYYDSLKLQQVRVKEEISTLRTSIENYWDLLEIDRVEREEFCQQTEGYSLDTLRALQKEHKKCENLKKLNIKKFVEKYRKELDELWDLCYCGNKEKEPFKFYNSDCYNEDLLDLFEMETTKWKTFYSENRNLIQLIKEHTRMWKKMLELEENASGPNRYKNRGGQLLKEERERNKISKKIPQIEEQLHQHAETFRELKGKDFYIFGNTIEEYINNLHEERDQERKNKLSAHKQLREKSTLTPAKSAINLFQPSSTNLRATPMSTTKRKIVLTTPATSTKKLKVESATKKLTCIKSEPFHTSRIKRLSKERCKKIKNLRRMSNKIQKEREVDENGDETASSTYDKFEDDLSKKDSGCRSTLHAQKEMENCANPKIEVIPATPRSRKLTTLRSNTKLLF